MNTSKKTSLSEVLLASYPILLKAIGYQFNDETLLLTALTHKSAAEKNNATAHGINNERLEFLGDAVLSLVTADYLYCQHNFMNEGDLSRLRAQFVCQENLSCAAKKINLGNYLVSDKSMRASGSNQSKAILADALEAVLGAVYLDGGFESAKSVIFTVLGYPLARLNHLEKDAKTKLQEIVQGTIQTAPKYVVLEVSGPPHAPTFLVGVKINDEIVASASGENKRTAAQNAAAKALEKFNTKNLEDELD